MIKLVSLIAGNQFRCAFRPIYVTDRGFRFLGNWIVFRESGGEVPVMTSYATLL